jgi:predicted transcriptional regulator
VSGAPFVRGSATAKAAALSVLPHLSRMRRKVLQAIVDRGPHGITCDAIEEATGMRHQSVSPRLRELESFGLIRESPAKAATASGRMASLWALTGGGALPGPRVKRPKRPAPAQLLRAAAVLLGTGHDDVADWLASIASPK